MPVPMTGRFVWHELHTQDPGRARAFYAQLLGWETSQAAAGPVEPDVVCVLGGKDFAAITPSKAPEHVPSHWLPYVAVESCDAAAARVKELGGKVLRGSVNVSGVMRFAVVTDPQGAVFGLYQPLARLPAEPDVPPPGSFCWDELITSDPSAAAMFYAAAFGFAVEERDMGAMGTYRILKRGDRQTAGVLSSLPGKPVHPHWMPYLATPDVDGATRKAKELGGIVVMEAQDIPKVGRFSAVDDPTGAGFALFRGA